MKRTFISMFIMALCLTFVSCKNKNENDQLLNEYENLLQEIDTLSKNNTRGNVLPDLIKFRKNTKELQKQYAALLEEAISSYSSEDVFELIEKAEILKIKLVEAELTPKQAERFAKILAKGEGLNFGEEEKKDEAEKPYNDEGGDESQL